MKTVTLTMHGKLSDSSYISFKKTVEVKTLSAHFAIHRDLDYGDWATSHLPTGFKLWRYDLLKQARDAVKEVEAMEGVDWSLTSVEAFLKATPDIVARLMGILKATGG